MQILAQSVLPRDAGGKRRVAVGAVALLLGVAAFGTVREPPVPPPQETVVEELRLPVAEIASGAERVYWHEVQFVRGDTFASMLNRLGVDGPDTARLLKENGRAKPFRNLRPGTTVQARVTEDRALLALQFLAPSQDELLGFERAGEHFLPREEPVSLSRHVVLKSGEIRSSLFAAADEVGLPDSVTTQVADIFGDIDFYRDLRRGDRFAVVYEVFYHNGQPLRAGRVLAAEFVNDEKPRRAVWFAYGDGKSGYYTPEGKNSRKAFLLSPLEFSRITSGVAMRFDPILKEWRAHTGVDYSAPAGTRVKATADGTAEFVGQQNGYGNVVILKHHGGITTLYAHLEGFAPGVHDGAHISQGEVIGYVGATGWATGPHLHYEFRVHNQHRNPLTIAMPAGEPVPAHLMAAFRAEARLLAEQLDLVANPTLARLD